MSDTIEITDANCKAEVMDVPGVVLVDFWAPWCNPCRLLAPAIDALATEFAGKVRVGKVNTDSSPQFTTDCNVTCLPTVLIFRDGEIMEKFVGVMTQKTLGEAIAKYLNTSAN